MVVSKKKKKAEKGDELYCEHANVKGIKEGLMNWKNNKAKSVERNE